MDKFEELSKLIKEKGSTCGGGMYTCINEIEGKLYQVVLFDNDVIESIFNGKKLSLYKNNKAIICDGKRDKKVKPLSIYSMFLIMILGREDAARKLQDDTQVIKATLEELNDPENCFTYKDFKVPILVGISLVLFIVCKYILKLF